MESQLAAASKKLQSGHDTIQSAQQQIEDSRSELDAQKKQLADVKAQLDNQAQQLAAAQTQWEQSKQKLDAAAGEVEQARAALAQLEAAGQGASQEAKTLRTQITAYEQRTAQLGTAKTELEENQKKLDTARQSYEKQAAAAQPKLEQAQQQIADAQNQLDKQQQTLADGEAAYRTQRQAAQEQLAAAKAKLDSAAEQIAQKTQELEAARQQAASGKTKLAAAQKTLAQNQAKYTQSKADTEAKLAKAEKQIADGEEKLKAVENPTWYVLNRDKNIGYNSFTGDADRMQSIARMFPLFFFLVAALVVLTTMTRMVDEERLQIGTYKALGFSSRQIARKYLLYAMIVSLSGSVTGVVVGCLTLPSVCWNAYRIMYNAPALIPRVDLFYSAVGCIASAAITLAATWGACSAVLRERPAALMQPKAPQPGRRILLERITPLWRHLNFSAKVTARNLFRYKRRLLMTVIGIAGCTALMLTGFGIRDSVVHIVSNQYDDLSQYNMSVELKQTAGISDGAKSILNNHERIRHWMQYACRSADIENTVGTVMSGNLLVPQNTKDLPEFVRLRDWRFSVRRIRC